MCDAWRLDSTSVSSDEGDNSPQRTEQPMGDNTATGTVPQPQSAACDGPTPLTSPPSRQPYCSAPAGQQTALVDSGSNEFQPAHGVAIPEMALFCFQVLVFHFYGFKDIPTPRFTNDAYPIFVTWRQGRHRRVRGCRGIFDHRPLHANLADMAIDSAIRDRRYAAISMQEVPELVCSLSILLRFEQAQHCFDWEVGVHGIRIFLQTPQGTLSSTFLPEIASDNGWTQLQTIDELLKKAGCGQPVTPDVLSSLRLVRYRTEKVTVTCADYVQYMNDFLDSY
ncbi:hypothetical protein ACOMHN_064017 [Nucella lapillus]